MSVVFINCTAETFTPTRSGAICTWLWEVCRVAARGGESPWVVTRTSTAAPYPWPNTVFVEYPRVPKNRVLSKLWYVHRGLTGWGHVRQKAYCLRLAAAVRRAGLAAGPFVLHNDIELAVFLRRTFPRAFILHLAHNNNACNEKFRRQFGGAVNVAAAVSGFCGRWNEEYFRLAPGRVETIHNGIDLERFTPAPERPEGPPVINFVGRTDSAKAPDLLLRAALLLSEKTTDFRLQILGSNHYGYSVPDEYQTQLESLSAELERRGVAVHRPGFVSRHLLPEELQKAHIHVVPSRWDEPFGLATVEGMASGLATVASRTGGTPEVVGDAGLLFGRDDVGELAGHLERLIADPVLRADYGRRARARAEEFPWERTWDQMQSLMGLKESCTSVS